MKMKFEFVETIPTNLKDGTVYISTKFATAIHLCACGCKREVVTPISPTEWTLIYKGESISLSPSIGNWKFDCKSHYWIKNNNVIWDEQLNFRDKDYNQKKRKTTKKLSFLEKFLSFFRK